MLPLILSHHCRCQAEKSKCQLNWKDKGLHEAQSQLHRVLCFFIAHPPLDQYRGAILKPSLHDLCVFRMCERLPCRCHESETPHLPLPQAPNQQYRGGNNNNNQYQQISGPPYLQQHSEQRQGSLGGPRYQGWPKPALPHNQYRHVLRVGRRVKDASGLGIGPRSKNNAR